MNRLLPPLILMAGLAACATPPQGPANGGGSIAPPRGSFPTGLEDSCDGERFGPLVGQDATALERVLFMGQVRINRPGSVTTQDYRPERINFQVGEDGRISAITCG